LFSNTTTHHCLQKRACLLVFEGSHCSALPPPTNLENEHTCSFLRLGIVLHYHYPPPPSKNEHVCSFSRLVVVLHYHHFLPPSNEHICSFSELLGI
jgi:hypothetical protein